MSRPSAPWLFLTTYALLYGAFGMQSPFVPALLHELGLQAQDIRLVLAAAKVVRVLAGLHSVAEELEQRAAQLEAGSRPQDPARHTSVESVPDGS